MVCYGFLLFMSVYVGLFHNWGYSPFTKWDVPPSRQSPAQPCLNLMEDQHDSLPLVRTFAGLGSKLGIWSDTKMVIIMGKMMIYYGFVGVKKLESDADASS
jgi:hypothetical protein